VGFYARGNAAAHLIVIEPKGKTLHPRVRQGRPDVLVVETDFFLCKSAGSFLVQGKANLCKWLARVKRHRMGLGRIKEGEKVRNSPFPKVTIKQRVNERKYPLPRKDTPLRNAKEEQPNGGWRGKHAEKGGKKSLLNRGEK